MGRDPADNTQALAAASFGLAEVILIVLVGRNIITLDELKDILLGTSFALEEETTRARVLGHKAQTTKDVQDLLMALLQRMERPGKSDKPEP